MKHVNESDAVGSDSKDYGNVWQGFMPDIAWGTLFLFAGVVVGYLLVLNSAINGWLPYPVATLICTYLAFVSFTVLHDAGHGAIFRMGSKLKPLETVIGWAASLPFIIVPYRFFQKIHDRHHAFTNDPDRDPDQYNFGESWYQIIAAGLWLPFQYYKLALTHYRSVKSVQDTWTSTIVYLLLVSAGMLALVQAGYGSELMYFGVIPAVLVVFLLAMFFDYIPHHPHKSRSRYHDTRIYPSRVLNVLLLGQNYHLIHHMYPRLPWYTYRSVYAEILPELEANNAAIEVFGHSPRPGFMKSTVMNQLMDDGRAINMLLTVKDIEKLSLDSVAVTFQLPSGESLKFQPGQYITVSKWLNGQQQTRCYSLCDAPGTDELRIGVRKTPDGLMSSYINQDLKVGDELVVQGPFGDFVYPPENKASSDMPESGTRKIEELVLIAGGSGITPILSIMKTGLASSDSLIHLVYASRSRDSLMFMDQVEKLRSLHTERLKVSYVLDQDTHEPLGIHGRLSKDVLSDLIPFGGDREYYICGPEGLKEMVVTTLSQNDVEYSRVHVEEFVKTVTEPLGELFDVSIISEDGEKHLIQAAANQSILEVASAQGIAIPHACGNGTCGSCKCKVSSGKVSQIDVSIPGITDQEQADGYTLACQGKPMGPLELHTL